MLEVFGSSVIVLSDSLPSSSSASSGILLRPLGLVTGVFFRFHLIVLTGQLRRTLSGGSEAFKGAKIEE
jgi:hypothetical protein